MPSQTRFFIEQLSPLYEAVQTRGIFPAFFQIAEMEQAEKVAQHLENKFLQPDGLATSLTRSGQQWDSPNGWAPLQWMTFQGLQNYGFDTLAAEIRQRWFI